MANRKDAATAKDAAKPKTKATKTTVPSHAMRTKLGTNGGASMGGAAGELAGIELDCDVRAIFGKARPPVIVTVNGYSFPSTISVYGGRSYVGIRKSHREAAKVEPGDTVDLVVTLDTSERKVNVPDDLGAALKKSAPARAAWDALSFTHQKEHVEAIVDAKRPETRVKRVEKTLEMLLAKGRPKK